MRTLTPAALANILQLEGTEPLIVVGIEWVANSVTYYCDKEIANAKGKILSIGEIESVIVGSKDNTSVQIELDDVDGELKTIIDKTNIHKINCIVYQFYTSWADKFVLFQGQIQSPFSWNEKTRSIGFTISSEIESFEVGFSPEEGQLEFVPQDLVGVAWPLGFGSVVHSRAVRVGKSLEGFREGELQEDLGIIDPILKFKLDSAIQAFNQSKFLFIYWLSVVSQAADFSRKAQEILNDYIAIIGEERAVMGTVALAARGLDIANDELRKGNFPPAIAFWKEQVKIGGEFLFGIGVQANITSTVKARIEDEVALCEYKYQIQKQAFQKAIEEYNTMRSIYGAILEIEQQICFQGLSSKTEILIKNGSTFPQGEEMDIYVEQVRFRGSFDGDLFTITAGPLYTYRNLAVDPWEPDSRPCAIEGETNGLNIFYLADDTINLRDMWILVTKVGDEAGQRHLLKVVEQEGNMVSFNIIGGNQSDDSSSGAVSIDSMIQQLIDVPLVATPFGVVPSDLFTGDWEASKWNNPDALDILGIINSIAGGVNETEFKFIAKLVYLKQYDFFAETASILPPSPRECFTIIGEDILAVTEASPIALESWFNDYSIYIEEWPDNAAWHVDTGTRVSTTAKDCDLYVVNILPSEIHGVYAYRTVKNGRRILAPVPSSYYIKNESANLGTIDVTCLTFPIALASRTDEGWEDDIYVTFTSSVGPNVVDVIQHLIETYSSGSVNAANFAAIKTKLELYPVGFTLFDRPNVLDEIERIAWETRCGIYRRGNEFFLRYLSEEPDSVKAIPLTESDIDEETHFSVVFPETENLVTRLSAIWRPDYLPTDKPYKVVLRHNVKQYGLHTDEIDFHIYNNYDLVLKSATFWLIRYANTWKNMTFKTFLNHLDLEVFDCVEFEFDQSFISDVGAKCILQQATYDPNDNSITMTVEFPIKAGEMKVYPLYWPALVEVSNIFPTVIEIEKGYAGGYGPGSGVTGTINDCGG